MDSFFKLSMILAFLSSVTFSSELNVLVFSYQGYKNSSQTGNKWNLHHDAITSAISMIQDISVENDWKVTVTDTPSFFTTNDLSQYDVIVFNNTIGYVFNTAERVSFQSYIQNGGGFFGIHAAAHMELDWPWFENLVGTFSNGHPPGTPNATVVVENPNDHCCNHFPHSWSMQEEWYNFRENPRDVEGMEILLTIDEDSYSGGTMGDDHPMSWRQEYDGGRMFYTALGHVGETFDREDIKQFVAKGLEWTAGGAELVTDGLMLDLNADLGLTLEDSDKVTKWTNQVPGVAQEFVINEIGRSESGPGAGNLVHPPGSGRPTLLTDIVALNGHNTLVFQEDELINFEEDTFDHLTQGSGFTWFAVISPYDQIVGKTDVNAFFGNLRNSNIEAGSSGYEGFWGALNDDNTLWISARNSGGGLFNTNNPRIVGPQLDSREYYLVAGRLQAGQGSQELELFVNEVTPVGSVQFPVNPNANPSKMAIGTERDATNHPGYESFDGEMARFLMYDRPLSDDELEATVSHLNEKYFGDYTNPVEPNPAESTVVFNFETGDLQGALNVEGDLPEVNDRAKFITTGQPYNKEGQYFLSTLEGPNHLKSDLYTGVIRSPYYKLTEGELSLLVGGGANSGLYFRVCKADGTEIFRTNRGTHGEALLLQEFDLSNEIGEVIYWELVDESTSTWGYIAVDDIRFIGEKVIIDGGFDFEGGTLVNATHTSGNLPSVHNRANFIISGLPYNKQGEYFLSTLEDANNSRSDSYTGTITSDLILLTTPDVSLLVGGGSTNDVYFAIYQCDGTEIYRTNKGTRGETLETREIDLSSHVGEAVYWKLVDESTNGWGYIAVDNIQFNKSGFDVWLEDYPELLDHASGDDPNEDGSPLLIDYILNLDPLDPSSELFFSMFLTESGNRFSFNRRASSTQDTTQMFQYSYDLNTWYSILVNDDSAEEVTINTTTAEMEEVEVSVDSTEAVEATKFFIRLKGEQ